MITESNDASATATASPAPSADHNPATAATPATENGSMPSTDAAADTGDPDSSESFLDPFAALDELGVNASLDGEVPSASASAAPVAEPTPKPNAADVEADPEDEPLDPRATAPQTEANSFRINLKDAADGDRKRALFRLIKNELGISMEEAIRRIGINPAAAAAKASEDTSPTTDSSPVAEVSDPLKVARDEIATLEAEEERLNGEFDFAGANKVGKKLRPLYAKLAKLEVQAEADQKVSATQQQSKFDSTISESWADVAKDYPDAGKAGTPFHAALTEAIAAKHKANPDFFKDPEWPLELAPKVARKLGLKPNAPAASAPAASSVTSATKQAPTVPTVQPRKPSTSVPPAPAPGGTAASGASTSAPSGPYDPFALMDNLTWEGAPK